MPQKSQHPLYRWLQRRDQTQADLARAVGVHRSYITHIVNGRRAPRLVLAKIAEHTHLSYRRLRNAGTRLSRDRRDA